MCRIVWTLSPVGVALFLALTTGCSSEGSISGKVTYQGRPVTGGTIVFTSAQGSSSSAIAADGSYVIMKMPTGAARIAVETKSAQASGSTNPKMGMGGPSKGGPGGGSIPKGVEIPPEAANSVGGQTPPKGARAEKIPENYADPETSGLTYTVKSGPQEYNVELK